MLLRGPLKIPFSTVSVKTGKAQNEQMLSGLPPIVLQNDFAHPSAQD
jgi:hypothetical protein